MIRNQRRKELRELEKEHKRIMNNRRFNAILKSYEFSGLSDEKIKELKERKSNNKQEQAEFDFVHLLISRVRDIDKRINELRLPAK